MKSKTKKTRISNNKVINDNGKESRHTLSNYFNKAFVLFLCIFVGFLNYAHVSYMQEHNVMFSHLSNLERELSFRTEMGFYYSFYKQVTNAPTIGRMLNLLIKDNLTEYPNTINALQRFNIYPELLLGVMYKYFIGIATSAGINTRTCYIVNRGDLPAVQSCEGLGEPTIFYVNTVMMLNGAMMAAFFLIGYVVSGGTIMGALLTCASYFFNHRECTRVQWTPPLRESFSYPFLVIQQFFLLQILNKQWYSEVSIVNKIGFLLTTLASLLSWQFAQFALLTQCLAIFLAYLIAGNESKKVIIRNTFIILIVADFINLFLQFNNTLLVTGPLRPCLIMACVLISFEPPAFYNRLQNSILAPLRWIVLMVLLLISTMILKYIIGFTFQIKSDDHMFDILQSKFSNFKSFDSQLYTCAPEFDFYDMSSILELSLTGLIPLAGCSLLIILFYIIFKWLQLIWTKNNDNSLNHFTDSGFCEIKDFYLFFQTIAYIIMAGFIMRLKLFATPQLCIMAALLCNQKWPVMVLSEKITNKLLSSSNFSGLSSMSKKLRVWPVILVLAIFSMKGVTNLQAEWGIHGSYSNWEQEQLMDFINVNTDPSDSFAGQMATMATVRLVTGRPIVIHPHYEDEELRRRVHMVYSVYSKKSVRDVWVLLRTKLQVKYIIYEHAHCQLKSHKPGCSYSEMWDLEDPDNADKSPVCLKFEDHVRGIYNTDKSNSPKALNTYFKWKFTTDNFAYSLFEVLDFPG